ncbi:MAG: hypothetical protein EZS28_045198 [Streblomastix strix]|uniref:Uncharacterized protein n=1 Tax=Streblomastix strix TaxID=222440 RepID=A0A5J4TL97_9EUKA|nr:MAG: hypothetical protein EZS28_045198 [Streblomastix strix]
MEGEAKCYESVDTLITNCDEERFRFTDEYLDSITPSGVPPHRLTLKTGAIVMLLRNIDVKEGLCNGTRLAVINSNNHVLQLEGITGELKGKRFFLPRMDMQPNNSKMLFKMTRRQFPVRLSFAMTINKSQGQSFERVGVLLNHQVFSHGQLYVAFSRCRSSDGLKVYSLNSAGVKCAKAKNIVLKSIIQ